LVILPNCDWGHLPSRSKCGLGPCKWRMTKSNGRMEKSNLDRDQSNRVRDQSNRVRDPNSMGSSSSIIRHHQTHPWGQRTGPVWWAATGLGSPPNAVFASNVGPTIMQNSVGLRLASDKSAANARDSLDAAKDAIEATPRFFQQAARCCARPSTTSATSSSSSAGSRRWPPSSGSTSSPTCRAWSRCSGSRATDRCAQWHADPSIHRAALRQVVENSRRAERPARRHGQTSTLWRSGPDARVQRGD
jgi:hypothetical protein